MIMQKNSEKSIAPLLSWSYWCARIWSSGFGVSKNDGKQVMVLGSGFRVPGRAGAVIGGPFRVSVLGIS